MARQSNADYWALRMKILRDALLDQSYAYVENLERQFDLSIAELERLIAVWYQRFAENNQITLAEAKRLLNSRELEELRWTVGEYIAYGEQNELDGAWKKQLENASARVHVSRLDALKLQIQQQAEVLFGNQLDAVDAAARQIYEGSYYHTAFEIQRGLGVGWSLQALNEEAVSKVLSRPWTADGQTFRARCWTNKQKLVSSVNTQLTQMIIRGEGPQQAITAITKQFRTSRSSAGKLVMTESAFFASAAQQDSFKALGVERYKNVAALDGDTCELCGDMDGRVFRMSEYQIGLTAPPFHPWCRCCTAPYFEDMAGIGERFARDIVTGERYKVPGNMTFKEWKSRNSSVANPGGSGILDTEGIKGIKITPSVIDNLPRVDLPGYSAEASEKIHNECVELLKMVMDEPIGTEAGIICDVNGVRRWSEIGSRGKGKISVPAAPYDHVFIHNHPSGEVFSGADLENFISTSEQNGVIAVGNDGVFFALIKREGYDGFSAVRRFVQTNTVLSECVKKQDADGYIAAIRKFLSEGEDIGLEFIERRY